MMADQGTDGRPSRNIVLSKCQQNQNNTNHVKVLDETRNTFDLVKVIEMMSSLLL